MFAWIARRHEVARQTEADAMALIAAEGAGAYAEARRRQQDAIKAEDLRALASRGDRDRQADWKADRFGHSHADGSGR